MADAAYQQIIPARDFFVTRPQHELPAAMTAAAVAKASGSAPRGLGSVPLLFQSNGITIGSVTLFVGTLPENVSAAQRDAFAAQLEAQQFYLQSALGLVTAHLANQHPKQPSEWTNPDNWSMPLQHLPEQFYSTSELERHRFQEKCAGVALPSKLLERLIRWGRTFALAGQFADLLARLGKQIRDAQQPPSTLRLYHLNFLYEPLQESEEVWQLRSTAEYYFIRLASDELGLYSSCTEPMSYNYELQYQKGSVLLNWPALVGTSQHERDQWNMVFTACTHDDLTLAKNFWTGKVGAA